MIRSRILCLLLLAVSTSASADSACTRALQRYADSIRHEHLHDIRAADVIARFRQLAKDDPQIATSHLAETFDWLENLRKTRHSPVSAGRFLDTNLGQLHLSAWLESMGIQSSEEINGLAQTWASFSSAQKLSYIQHLSERIEQSELTSLFTSPLRTRADLKLSEQLALSSREINEFNRRWRVLSPVERELFLYGAVSDELPGVLEVYVPALKQKTALAIQAPESAAVVAQSGNTALVPVSTSAARVKVSKGLFSFGSWKVDGDLLRLSREYQGYPEPLLEKLSELMKRRSEMEMDDLRYLLEKTSVFTAEDLGSEQRELILGLVQKIGQYPDTELFFKIIESKAFKSGSAVEQFQFLGKMDYRVRNPILDTVKDGDAIEREVVHLYREIQNLPNEKLLVDKDFLERSRHPAFFEPPTVYAHRIKNVLSRKSLVTPEDIEYVLSRKPQEFGDAEAIFDELLTKLSSRPSARRLSSWTVDLCGRGSDLFRTTCIDQLNKRIDAALLKRFPE